MKNIFIKSLTVLAAAVTLTACIKETLPESSTATAPQVAKSSSALQAMLNSIPAAMVTTAANGYYSDYGVHWDFGIGALHLATENMLEDWATGGENPYYNRFYPWAMCQNQDARYIYCAYFWDCYYKWIKTCNDVIGSVKSAGEPTGEAAVILGQALAYRASFYLDLARLFEPKPNKYIDVSAVLGLTVPIITEETAGSANPRAKREDMYRFILNDLEEAAKYLEGVSLPYTTPGINAVYGLMARAYLEKGAAGDQGAYEKAIEYADKVISAGYTPLTQSQWEDPVNGFNNGASNKAWVWGIGITPENFNNIVTYAAHICTEGQWGYAPLVQICASKRFYEAIPANDFRKHSWLDPQRMDFYPYKLAGTSKDQEGFLKGNDNVPAAVDYESIKFRPGSGNCTEYNAGNAIDQPMMRVEEMYFIKMEATAATNLESAKALLNDFMKFRYSTGTYICTAADKAAFLEEMLFQKRVEFFGEGILIFDYKRLDKGITRGYKGTNWPADFCINCEGRSPQWTLVITRAEYQSNEAISEELNNPDPSNFVPLWSDDSQGQ